jgi:hypothetical protein
MFSITKPFTFLAGIAVLALASALPVLRAADAPAATTGTVSGTLVDADGKALTVTAKVSIAAPKEKGSKDKPKPIATVESDATGAYSFKDVPPGTYTVMAKAKGVGAGHTTAPITVEAGKDTKVDPITLKPKK